MYRFEISGFVPKRLRSPREERHWQAFMYGKFVGECCRRPSSTAPEGALSLYVGGVYLITNSSEGSLHSPLRQKKERIHSCKHGVCVLYLSYKHFLLALLFYIKVHSLLSLILYKRNYILYLSLSYNGISSMIIPTIPPCPMVFQTFERQFVDIQRGILSFSPQKESLQAN